MAVGVTYAGIEGYREAARNRAIHDADAVPCRFLPHDGRTPAYRRGAALGIAMRATPADAAIERRLATALAIVDGWTDVDPWTAHRIARDCVPGERMWFAAGSVVFYHADHPLSNMHPTRLDHDGTWTSVEALYQAGKFAGDPEAVEAIRSAPDGLSAKAVSHRLRTTRGAARTDRRSLVPRLSMTRTLLLRAAQDPAYRAALLATGDADLVENAPGERVDPHWGAIGTRALRGSNLAGRLSMAVRAAVRDRPLPSSTTD